MTAATRAAARTRSRPAGVHAPRPAKKLAAKKTMPATAPPTRSRPRSTPKLPKFAITVDDRTVEMTEAALFCRESGHHWNRVPQGPDRRALLAHRGQAETVRVCATCASQRIELYWLPTFETAAAVRYVWSPGYLIAKQFAGSGRLSRADVRKALFARDNPDLLAA
jgi:hypothetical protein